MVRMNCHMKMVQETLKPCQAERVRPWIAKPTGASHEDSSVSSVTLDLLALACQRSSILRRRTPRLGHWAVGFQLEERAPHSSGYAMHPCREGTLSAQSIDPLQSDVNDRSWRQRAAARRRKYSEGKSHCGAAPVTASSEPTTRDMSWARCWCLASQPTTSFGECAATRTSAPHRYPLADEWTAAPPPTALDAQLRQKRSGVAVRADEVAGFCALEPAARPAVKPRRVSARRA